MVREHRVDRAVRHLVAVEAVGESHRDVRRKLVEILVERDPLVEVRAGVPGREPVVAGGDRVGVWRR